MRLREEYNQQRYNQFTTAGVESCGEFIELVVCQDLPSDLRRGRDICGSSSLGGPCRSCLIQPYNCPGETALSPSLDSRART
jgi:hypothetical protein